MDIRIGRIYEANLNSNLHSEQRRDRRLTNQFQDDVGFKKIFEEACRKERLKHEKRNDVCNE